MAHAGQKVASARTFTAGRSYVLGIVTGLALAVTMLSLFVIYRY